MQNINYLTIPASVVTIGNYAFYNCSGLISVTFNEGLETIGMFAFANCSYLSKVTLPSTVKIIDQQAFSNCVKLSNVTLNEGLEYLGSNAFNGCEKLTTISLPSTLKYIGSGVFSGTGITYNEYENGYYLGNETNNYMVFVSMKDRTISTCNINSNTVIIAPSAFGNSWVNNGALTTVNIPLSLRTICDYAFDGCPALSEINYSGTLEQWNFYVNIYPNNDSLKSATVNYNYTE